jgi:hypothetical protein
MFEVTKSMTIPFLIIALTFIFTEQSPMSGEPCEPEANGESAAAAASGEPGAPETHGASAAPDALEVPEIPGKPTKSSHPLEGSVQIQEEANQNLLTGVWHARIIEFRRHPTVSIENQQGTELQGTYKGLIGKFPLTGVYDQSTSSIRLFVDLSQSRMAKWRGLKEGIAVLKGTVKGDTMTGTANIPELSDRQVHFEAKRAIANQKIQSIDESQTISAAAVKTSLLSVNQ